MQTESNQRAALEQTPKLDGLLRSLRSLLRRSVLLYGLGTLLLALSAWLAFAFLADWGLRVPGAFRVFNGLILAAIGLTCFWRFVLRPLAGLPRQRELALLLERSNPGLDEVLSSAIEFQSEAGSGNSVLIQSVLTHADQSASQLQTSSVLDPRPVLSRLIKGLAAGAILVLVGALQPMHAEIFFNRMLGGEMSWPRRTRLSLELPGFEPEAFDLDADQNPGLLRLRVARGTDIPILIRAAGIAPDQVELHLEGGRSLELKRTGKNIYRTQLSSCQEDVQFHVTGGDDDSGRPRVEVSVLQPPDIASIAIRITPPAYSGEPERVVFNSDVEVLRGSELRLHASTLPADATGQARLLPADELITLQRGPFPPSQAAEGEQAPADTGKVSEALYLDHLALSSVGFQFLLRDKSGLSNPEPGLFQIKVYEDEAPEILTINPARTDIELVQGGMLPLRARFSDDFGMRDATWHIRPTQIDEALGDVLSGPFDLRPLPRDESSQGDERLMLGAARIEVDQLGSAEIPLAVDQRFLIEFRATDSREPMANQSLGLPIRARVVTKETLRTRMQERLAQAVREARKLKELQTEKHRRVDELIETFDEVSDGNLQASGESTAMAAALSGQRRVLGDAQALARSLARVAEDILFARLDPSANDLLNLHLTQLEAMGDVGFQSAPWLALAESARAKRGGPEGFARNLILLVDLALEISDQEVQGAALALDQAERAIDLGTRQEALARSFKHQKQALAKSDLLLEKLAEWDNFQNVLTLMQDILNRQKNLVERTQQYATDNKK